MGNPGASGKLPAQPLIQAAAALGNSGLSRDQHLIKVPKPDFFRQVLKELPRQVHIAEQAQRLALPPECLDHWDKIGISPAQGSLHLELRIHALLRGKAGQDGQLLPNLPEGHLPGTPGGFLAPAGQRFCLHSQTLKIRKVQLGSHQGKGILWAAYRPEQQGVEQVKGHHVKGCQLPGQQQGRLPQTLGGLPALRQGEQLLLASQQRRSGPQPGNSLAAQGLIPLPSLGRTGGEHLVDSFFHRVSSLVTDFSHTECRPPWDLPWPAAFRGPATWPCCSSPG